MALLVDPMEVPWAITWGPLWRSRRWACWGPVGGLLDLRSGSGGGPVGPEGGPEGPGDGAAFSIPSMAPNAPSSMEPRAASSACSRAASAEVFFAAMVVPDYAIPRGLNSGSVTERCLRPAWCRGYHAGLSFLRPGFNSGAGASLISLVNCHSATHSAPDLDAINSWGCPCDVDARSTLALDNIAHGHPNASTFMNSALVLV